MHAGMQARARDVCVQPCASPYFLTCVRMRTRALTSDRVLNTGSYPTSFPNLLS